MYVREQIRVVDNSKISSPGLIRPDAKELFSNMIVDKKQSVDKKVVLHFLGEEFGVNRKFSDSFVNKVLENLKHI